MRILVIGSRGFIGSHCVEYFSRGNDVFGCDIFDIPGNNYSTIRNAGDFSRLFSSLKFDLCINASGSADVGFSIAFPDRDYELNVSNVAKMLEAMRENNAECRYINFSSAAVYGNPESLPVAESAKTKPLSPYGSHKLEAEQLLKKYHEEAALRTCSLRAFSAYGPGLRKQLFWDIFQKSKQGDAITLYGTGQESRDFVFVDDLVSAVECAAKNAPFCGEAINVSSGVETTIETAANTFLKHLGISSAIVFNGLEKPGDPKHWRADIARISQMGFVPSHTFEQGIIKVAKWLREDT